MMKRLIAVTAFGAGYVLGAAAGRERYEQIRKLALRIKDDPHVHHLAEVAVDKVMPNGQSVRDAFDVMANPYQRATP